MDLLNETFILLQSRWFEMEVCSWWRAFKRAVEHLSPVDGLLWKWNEGSLSI